MSRQFFLCLFFACFGITAEIFFVAFTNLYNNTPFCNEPLMSLTGKTYVWMALIYALIPFFAGILYNRMQYIPWVVRLLVYTGIILCVEFISGFVLEQLTGECPWKYNEGWHIMGYVRLDYTPAWMFFAAIVEYLYRFIDNKF
jgi:uncharacterized membrane protein